MITEAVQSFLEILDETKMDLLQLLSSLFIGAVSAWVAGTLGVRHGLRRSQRERAFERRLLWYEKTFRLIDSFRSVSTEFLLGFDKFQRIRRIVQPDVHLGFDEQEQKLVMALETRLKELDECFEEAIMFAERSVLLELQSFRSEFVEVQFAAMPKEFSDNEKQVLIGKVEKLHEIMDRLIVKIGTSVRFQLGLDKIEPCDLKSNNVR